MEFSLLSNQLSFPKTSLWNAASTVGCRILELELLPRRRGHHVRVVVMKQRVREKKQRLLTVGLMQGKVLEQGTMIYT